LIVHYLQQYESKSLEELRCEDYAAGRRAPQQQQQQQQTLGLFGQSAAGTNLFGGEYIMHSYARNFS
jgi:hypothetical protein